MKALFLFFALSFILLSSSCNKDCFDQELYNQYNSVGCTTDCPGVTGCDGKTYCNECEANRQGIRAE